MQFNATQDRDENGHALETWHVESFDGMTAYGFGMTKEQAQQSAAVPDLVEALRKAEKRLAHVTLLLNDEGFDDESADVDDDLEVVRAALQKAGVSV